MRVVIETTGLADPVPVISTLMYDRVLQHHFRIGNVITTVDALNGGKNLTVHPQCLKQAVLADRLVLTKLDLALPDQVDRLRTQLHAINPTAYCLPTDGAPVSASLLLGADVFDMASKSQEVAHWLEAANQRQFLAIGQRTPDLADTNSHGDIRALTVNLPDAVDWTVFAVWLSLLLHVHGERILRVKGLLNVDGADTPVVIHGVQQLVYPPTHLDRWPDDDRESRLVFIVQGLAPATIQRSLQAYLNEL
jgi:G3E family GTPase